MEGGGGWMEESTIFVNGSKFKAKKKLKLFKRTAYLITGFLLNYHLLNFIKKKLNALETP